MLPVHLVLEHLPPGNQVLAGPLCLGLSSGPRDSLALPGCSREGRVLTLRSASGDTSPMAAPHHSSRHLVHSSPFPRDFLRRKRDALPSAAGRPPTSPAPQTDRSFGNGFLKRPVRRVARRSRAQPPEGSSCRAGRARGFPGVGRSEVGCSLRPTATFYPRPPRPPATPPGQGRAHRGRLVNIDGLFFVRQRFRLHELDKHERFGKTPGEAGKRDLIRVREASARTLALGFLPFHTQSRAATGREDPRGPL